MWFLRWRRFMLLGSMLVAPVGALDCVLPDSTELAEPAGSPLLSAAIPAAQPASLHAVLINGGGFHQVNYASHRQHLEKLLGLLEAGGVDPAHVTIFASDGADPTPDLAIRAENETPDFWLLPRGVAEYLAPQIEYVNTELGGAVLRTATRAELEKWFKDEGSQLRKGDSLLLYVTDHGNKNDADVNDNTISLWNEDLSVRQLQGYLDLLDPDVRVVMLMSQCFGGSFANAIFASDDAGKLRGNVCGYFATTADRPAFGCYPETSGREGIGHAHEIFEAWSQVGELQRAHRRSAVTDGTPDVPNTSRDFYFSRMMQREAELAGASPEAFVDRWLQEAWKDRRIWEPEIRLLDRIAHAFGLFSPRSLAELESEATGLPQLSEQLDTYTDRWEQTLDAARRESWLRFVADRPQWRALFVSEIESLRSLKPEARDALREKLLAELVPFIAADGDTHERLLALKRKADDASSARYRAEVRIGAVLRMRTILTSIAGRAFVQRTGSAEQNGDYEHLARCEALTLTEPVTRTAAFEAPEALPQLAEDRSLIESVMPSWLGIRYQPMRAAKVKGIALPRGAVQVMSVYPDAPAAKADMRVADIVLGTPGQPFAEEHAIREWTMRSDLGRPTPLEVLRGGETLEVTIVPASFPLELPSLPGPPQVGSVAPPLELEPYRGDPLLASRPRLLFFWATWCGPCKQSVPELLAFAEAQDVQILAITDESPEQLDGFFHGFAADFPASVASDPLRASFLSYGVSATPTFVLVDPDGMIRHYQRGYDAENGLRIDGWRYVRSER